MSPCGHFPLWGVPVGLPRTGATRSTVTVTGRPPDPQPWRISALQADQPGATSLGFDVSEELANLLGPGGASTVGIRPLDPMPPCARGGICNIPRGRGTRYTATEGAQALDPTFAGSCTFPEHEGPMAPVRTRSPGATCENSWAGAQSGGAHSKSSTRWGNSPSAGR